MEVVRQPFSQERIPECSGEQTIDGLVSRVMKEVVQVIPLFPRRSPQQRTAEEIVAPKQEAIVHVVKVIPPPCPPECMVATVEETFPPECRQCVM